MTTSENLKRRKGHLAGLCSTASTRSWTSADISCSWTPGAASTLCSLLAVTYQLSLYRCCRQHVIYLLPHSASLVDADMAGVLTFLEAVYMLDSDSNRQDGHSGGVHLTLGL